MWIGLGAIALTVTYLVIATQFADGYSLSLIYDEVGPASSAGADQPLGSSGGPSASSEQYRFLLTQRRSDEPVTFDPCRTIEYVVRDDGGPTNGLELIQQAVADTSEASGLAFEYVGETDESPAPPRSHYQPERYGDKWAPVLIAWSGPTETTALAGDVTGVTFQKPTVADNRLYYVSGTIALDADDLAAAGGSVPPERVLPTIRHELAHLVGLAHVQDPSQLMNPHGNRFLETFSDGDLTGLQLLGQGKCSADL
jgi:hypothetical protein